MSDKLDQADETIGIFDALVRERDELIDILKAVREDRERALNQRDELRAEVERLRLELRQVESVLAQSTANLNQATPMIERLRVALAEMLESFTEPEDDNDILRRARAALVKPKE